MKVFSCASFLLFGIVSSAAPQPPYWGPTWTAAFDQSITYPPFQWNNTVLWSYDSTTKPVGSSIYFHGKGQHDEICTGVVGKEMSDAPCNLLASTDTWRYVIYPETSECCRVCNTSDYCGIVRPDWLQQNATYQGRETIAGLDCEGWMKQGGEQNYWYAEVTTQQPCLYYEGYPVLPDTSNYWRFIPSNFSRSVPQNVFNVPSGCTAMCQMSSVSYAERLEARFKAGVGSGSLVKATPI